MKIELTKQEAELIKRALRNVTHSDVDFTGEEMNYEIEELLKRVEE